MGASSLTNGLSSTVYFIFVPRASHPRYYAVGFVAVHAADASPLYCGERT